MSIILPNVSKVQWLTRVLADQAAWLCHLFTNTPSLGNATVIGDLTEATFTGYSAVTPSFGAPSVVSNEASALGAAQTFTLTAGSQTIVGWYITDGSGNLIAVGNLPTPVALTVSVPILRVTPTLLEDTL